MTVITIVLIAIVLAVGTVIVRDLMSNTSSQSDCSSKGNIWYDGKCYTPDKCKTITSTGETKCEG